MALIGFIPEVYFDKISGKRNLNEKIERFIVVRMSLCIP